MNLVSGERMPYISSDRLPLPARRTLENHGVSDLQEEDVWFDSIDWDDLDEVWSDARNEHHNEPASVRGTTGSPIPFTEDCRRGIQQLISILGEYKQSELLSVLISKILPGTPVNIVMIVNSLYKAITEQRNIDTAVLHSLGLGSQYLPDDINVISHLAASIREAINGWAEGVFPPQFLGEEENPAFGYLFTVLGVTAILAKYWMKDDGAPQRGILKFPAFAANLLIRAGSYWNALENMARNSLSTVGVMEGNEPPPWAPAFEVDTCMETSRELCVDHYIVCPPSKTQITAFSSNSTVYPDDFTQATVQNRPVMAPEENHNIAEKAHFLAMEKLKQESRVSDLLYCATHKTETHQREDGKNITNMHINTKCDAMMYPAPLRKNPENRAVHTNIAEPPMFSATTSRDHGEALLPLVATAVAVPVVTSYTQAMNSRIVKLGGIVAGLTVFAVGGKLLSDKFWSQEQEGADNVTQPDSAQIPLHPHGLHEEKEIKKGWFVKFRRYYPGETNEVIYLSPERNYPMEALIWRLWANGLDASWVEQPDGKNHESFEDKDFGSVNIKFDSGKKSFEIEGNEIINSYITGLARTSAIQDDDLYAEVEKLEEEYSKNRYEDYLSIINNRFNSDNVVKIHRGLEEVKVKAGPDGGGEKKGCVIFRQYYSGETSEIIYLSPERNYPMEALIWRLGANGLDANWVEHPDAHKHESFEDKLFGVVDISLDNNKNVFEVKDNKVINAYITGLAKTSAIQDDVLYSEVENIDKYYGAYDYKEYLFVINNRFSLGNLDSVYRDFEEERVKSEEAGKKLAEKISAENFKRKSEILGSKYIENIEIYFEERQKDQSASQEKLSASDLIAVSGTSIEVKLLSVVMGAIPEGILRDLVKPERISNDTWSEIISGELYEKIKEETDNQEKESADFYDFIEETERKINDIKSYEEFVKQWIEDNSNLASDSKTFVIIKKELPDSYKSASRKHDREKFLEEHKEMNITYNLYDVVSGRAEHEINRYLLTGAKVLWEEDSDVFELSEKREDSFKAYEEYLNGVSIKDSKDIDRYFVFYQKYRGGKKRSLDKLLVEFRNNFSETTYTNRQISAERLLGTVKEVVSGVSPFVPLSPVRGAAFILLQAGISKLQGHISSDPEEKEVYDKEALKTVIYNMALSIPGFIRSAPRTKVGRLIRKGYANYARSSAIGEQSPVLGGKKTSVTILEDKRHNFFSRRENKEFPLGDLNRKVEYERSRQLPEIENPPAWYNELNVIIENFSAERGRFKHPSDPNRLIKLYRKPGSEKVAQKNVLALNSLYGNSIATLKNLKGTDGKAYVAVDMPRIKGTSLAEILQGHSDREAIAVAEAIIREDIIDVLICKLQDREINARAFKTGNVRFDANEAELSLIEFDDVDVEVSFSDAHYERMYKSLYSALKTDFLAKIEIPIDSPGDFIKRAKIQKAMKVMDDRYNVSANYNPETSGLRVAMDRYNSDNKAANPDPLRGLEEPNQYEPVAKYGRLDEMVIPTKFILDGRETKVAIQGNELFKSEVEKALKEIASTNVGKKLFNRLNRMTEDTLIHPPAQEAIARAEAGKLYYANSVGSTGISFDPENKIVGGALPVAGSWRNRPASVGLYHELVHSLSRKGEVWESSGTLDGRMSVYTDGIDSLGEARVVGLKYRHEEEGIAFEFPFDNIDFFAKNNIEHFTENQYRKELAEVLGIEVVPRTEYGGVTQTGALGWRGGKYSLAEHAEATTSGRSPVVDLLGSDAAFFHDERRKGALYIQTHGFPFNVNRRSAANLAQGIEALAPSVGMSFVKTEGKQQVNYIQLYSCYGGAGGRFSTAQVLADKLQVPVRAYVRKIGPASDDPGILFKPRAPGSRTVSFSAFVNDKLFHVADMLLWIRRSIRSMRGTPNAEPSNAEPLFSLSYNDFLRSVVNSFEGREHISIPGISPQGWMKLTHAGLRFRQEDDRSEPEPVMYVSSILSVLLEDESLSLRLFSYIGLAVETLDSPDTFERELMEYNVGGTVDPIYKEVFYSLPIDRDVGLEDVRVFESRLSSVVDNIMVAQAKYRYTILAYLSGPDGIELPISANSIRDKIEQGLKHSQQVYDDKAQEKMSLEETLDGVKQSIQRGNAADMPALIWRKSYLENEISDRDRSMNYRRAKVSEERKRLDLIDEIQIEDGSSKVIFDVFDDRKQPLTEFVNGRPVDPVYERAFKSLPPDKDIGLGDVKKQEKEFSKTLNGLLTAQAKYRYAVLSYLSGEEGEGIKLPIDANLIRAELKERLDHAQDMQDRKATENKAAQERLNSPEVNSLSYEEEFELKDKINEGERLRAECIILRDKIDFMNKVQKKYEPQKVGFDIFKVREQVFTVFLDGRPDGFNYNRLFSLSPMVEDVDQALAVVHEEVLVFDDSLLATPEYHYKVLAYLSGDENIVLPVDADALRRKIDKQLKEKANTQWSKEETLDANQRLAFIDEIQNKNNLRRAPFDVFDVSDPALTAFLSGKPVDPNYNQTLHSLAAAQDNISLREVNALRKTVFEEDGGLVEQAEYRYAALLYLLEAPVSLPIDVNEIQKGIERKLNDAKDKYDEKLNEVANLRERLNEVDAEIEKGLRVASGGEGAYKVEEDLKKEMADKEKELDGLGGAVLDASDRQRFMEKVKSESRYEKNIFDIFDPSEQILMALVEGKPLDPVYQGVLDYNLGEFTTRKDLDYIKRFLDYLREKCVARNNDMSVQAEYRYVMLTYLSGGKEITLPVDANAIVSKVNDRLSAAWQEYDKKTRELKGLESQLKSVMQLIYKHPNDEAALTQKKSRLESKIAEVETSIDYWGIQIEMGLQKLNIILGIKFTNNSPKVF